MSLRDYIPLYRELIREAAEKTAGISPKQLRSLLIGGGVGLAAGAIPATLIAQHRAEKERKKTRNRSFGAGMAVGVATPHLLKGLMSIAQRAGVISPEALMSSGGM